MNVLRRKTRTLGKKKKKLRKSLAPPVDKKMATSCLSTSLSLLHRGRVTFERERERERERKRGERNWVKQTM